jgi:hypothetical protein
MLSKPHIMDDIHYQFEFILFLTRHLQGKVDSRAVLDTFGRRSLALWDLVHNRNAQPLTIISHTSEMRRDEHLTYASILILFRPSSAGVFVFGGESPEELMIVEILDDINSRPGSGTVLVLITGLDGWSTDARSIIVMVSRWKNIRFRLTFLAPAASVEALVCFHPRKFCDDGPHAMQFSWAHFKLSEVASLAHKFWDGDQDALWLGAFDQGCLLHILLAVEDDKDVRAARQDSSRHHRWVNWDALFDIRSVDFLRIKRHSMALPEIHVKRCLRCHSETGMFVRYIGDSQTAEMHRRFVQSNWFTHFTYCWWI